MARTKYLPEEYTDVEGNRLQEGQWVRWDVGPALFWQVKQAAQGEYQVVAPARQQTRTITALLTRQFRSLPFPLSKKIRLDDYPELYKRFHDRGIDAFFVTLENSPRPRLLLIKPRAHLPLPALPNVAAAKKDSALLELWLEQAIWIAEHPKKYRVLEWAANTGYVNPFGKWPEITPPKSLDKWAKEWHHAYQDYLEQGQVEQEQYLQSLHPPAPRLPGQLPPEYFSLMGDTYPLVVGEWVSTIHLYGTSIKSPLRDAYLWRIQEPEPGLYSVVGYGVEQTVVFTPKISAKVYPLAIKVSERLALDKYSKYLHLYLTKGLGAFFYENAHRDMVLRMVVLSKANKDTQDIVLEPSMVVAMERNPELLERWLDQMMWCMLNPERSKILFWALEHGIPVFGVWPQLIHALELAQVANLFSSIYDAEKSREKTPGELVVEQRQLAYKIELNEQTKLMNELQLGMLDNSISDSIQSLLDGTGIDRPE